MVYILIGECIIKTNQKNKGTILAVLVAVFIFSILIIIEVVIYNSIMTNKRNELAEKYIVIEDRISNIIDTNFDILKGFSAYVQTTNQFTEENVYHFLDILFEDTDTFIRNIGILKTQQLYGTIHMKPIKLLSMWIC